MSWISDELAHLRKVFTKKFTAAEEAMAPVEAELKPVAEAALKAVLAVGVTTLFKSISGGPLTLSQAEAAAIAAGRAMAAAAKTQGVQLTEHVLLAVSASLAAGVAAAPVDDTAAR